MAALEPWARRWDGLAVEARRPYCAPGWMLPWWEHLRPAGARLHVVLVVDGSTLLGVAPFYAQRGIAGRTDLRLLACELSHGLDLLATPGHEATVARVVARALADAAPSLVSFENVAAGTVSWPETIRAAWPRRLRPASPPGTFLPTPLLELAGRTHAEWLAGRSRNFRQQIGQTRRRVEAAGGRVALCAGRADQDAALAAFERLHAMRWAERGGTTLPEHGLGGWLGAVADRHREDGRLRLWTLSVGGEIVAVQIFLAAGGEVAYWNGGWDERHARLRPALLTMVAAVEDAFERGDRRLDLGGGSHQYKLRIADEPVTRAVTTRVLVPVGRRYPLVRAAVLRRQARRAVVRRAKRLPEHRQRQLRALASRGRRVAARVRP